MADETASIPQDQLSGIIAQLLSGRTAQPAVDPNAGASSAEGRGLLSRVGEALGGGSQYGSTQERESGGLTALGALGARMLQASDWSAMPHTFGSILGQGLEAARGSLGQTQAVSAARQHAAQQYAHEANADQIARLKEALPYLQLQRDNAAMARMRAGLTGDNTSIGAAGVTSGTLFDALAQIESNDSNIVSGVDKDSKGRTLAQGGNAQEISQGHFQIQTATWKDFAPKAGVDVSKYPNAMTAPKEVQAQVASVIPLARFGPRTQKMLQDRFGTLDTSKTVGELAATRTPTAPAPVGQNPTAKVQIPPPRGPAAAPPATTPPAGRATLPPPEAPIAGTAQTAGDVGAPTGTVIPPSPAGSEAHTQDIISGMVAAGADPTTLAPGPGSSPSAQPGAVVTAQAGGQPVAPTFQMRPLTPTEQAATSYALDPQVERALQLRINGATNPKELSEAIDARKTALIEQRKTADAARLKIEETTRKDWRDERAKVEDETRKQANAKELELIKSGLTIDQQGALVALEGDKHRMTKAGEAAAAVLPVSEQLRQLPAVMRDLPPGGGTVSSIIGQFPQLTSMLETANLIPKGTTDAVTVFNGLTNHLSGQLRVAGSGSMSDKDLATFKTVLPQLLQSPDGRAKAVAFLQNISDRVVEGQEFTQEYFSRIDQRTGKPAHNLRGLTDAINAPRRVNPTTGINEGGLGPVLPAAPRFSQDENGYRDAQAWIQTNVRSGHPFTAWLPNEKGVLTQQILVRE